ncbi:MAG TPA: hypothetical protein VJ895_01305 [Candidatus Nanoarchaeia archaeon]|nr:hypothetical protein [Candidatus Nanoarchaeia archaeon]
MSFRTEKRRNSHEDFETRKEQAIQKIKDKVFVATKKKTYQFTEKELREDFEFDDIHQMYDKFDNFFTDATFLLYPEEKIIEV